MNHLVFSEELSPSGKTKKVSIRSEYDGTFLGWILWSGRWRQYVFSPNIQFETIWSHDCLEDLKNRIIGLNKEQRDILRRRKKAKSYEEKV